jgi:hypothetical protein
MLRRRGESGDGSTPVSRLDFSDDTLVKRMYWSKDAELVGRSDTASLPSSLSPPPKGW